jgi:glycosyltransferase involved in cell wall biosynthesis
MNKSICLTTQEFPPDIGGVGESAKRIALLLKQLGYEVHVAVFRGVFRREKQLAEAGKFGRSCCQTSEQDGIVVHRLQPAVRSTVARTQDYLADIYGQLISLQKKYQFNLFHAFFINETGFLTTMLAKENGLPVINSVRGADLHKHIFDPKQQAQIAWTLENSTWTTFVSQDLMNRARLFVPAITNKSSTFWNSIVPIEFDKLPTPKLLDKLSGTVIASVGNFRDKKGIEYLLDACEKVPIETEFTLLLIGDFVAKEKGYWQQELSHSKITNRLVITGIINRTETLSYLPHVDIFAIPSLNDGCPNALLEAMLAGKAIVGTNTDAIGEIIEDEVDGLLVNPYSSEELFVALKKLIAQPTLQQQLGQAAREKVLEQLNPSVEQQNWAKIYHQILETPTQKKQVKSQKVKGKNESKTIGLFVSN